MTSPATYLYRSKIHQWKPSQWLFNGCHFLECCKDFHSPSSNKWLSGDFIGPCSSDQNIPWLTSTFEPPLLILVWSVLHIADRRFLPRFPHGLPSLFCPAFLPPDERAFTFCPVLALSSIFRVTPTKMRPPDLRPAQAAPSGSNELGKQSKSFSSDWLTNFSFGLAIKAVSHGA